MPLAGDVAQPQLQLGGGVARGGPRVEFGQGGRDGRAGIGAGGEAETEQNEQGDGGEVAGIQCIFRALAGAFSMLSISAATA